jgi:AraC-like DNA-binding protein
VPHQARARHLVKARDLVDARYFEPLTVADLAAAAALSPAYFSREFKRVYGESPHEYLLTRRLERAASLLRTTNRTVTEIAFSVGLSSLGSFTTSFTRIYGRSPKAYRESFPPAQAHVRIPRCVIQAYSRPLNRPYRTFREATTEPGP